MGVMVIIKKYLKPLLEQRYFRDEIGDGVSEGFLWTVIWSGLDAQDYLMLQWMWMFVSRKQHLRILQHLPAKVQHFMSCQVRKECVTVRLFL